MASSRSFRERGGDFSSRRGAPLSDEVVRASRNPLSFFLSFLFLFFGKKKVVGDDENKTVLFLWKKNKRARVTDPNYLFP